MFAVFERSPASCAALATTLILILVLRGFAWLAAPSLVVFGVVLFAVRALQSAVNISKLPPGPWGLPVFGYLPFLRSDAYLQFGEMARRYGSLFSTRLGNQLIVVLSDHRAIREAFRREEFTGRPHTEFSNILGGYGKSRFILSARSVRNSAPD